MSFSPDARPANTKAALDQVHESKTVMALFIGYLVSSCIQMPVDAYTGPYAAYFCIQGRGTAAMAATACVLIAGALKYCSHEIDSMDVGIDEADKPTNQVYQDMKHDYITSFSWLHKLVHAVQYLCIFVFMAGFSISIHSRYTVGVDEENALSFDFYWVLFTIISLWALLSILITHARANQVMNALQRKFPAERRGGSAARSSGVSSFI